MSNKFRYPIDPEKIYTIKGDDFFGEVTGEEIIGAFRRQILLDKVLQEVNFWMDSEEDIS